MAGPFYVDPDAGGGETGADWTNAWLTLQTALDTAVSGEIIYCRNTETLGAPLDVDTNSGGLTNGVIKIIGCNAAGNIDGTRFVIDAASTAANCILTDAQTHLWWENIELKGATGDNFDATGSADYWWWVNCISHNAGASGWDLTSADRHGFIRCKSYANGNDGWEFPGFTTRFFFCVAYDNTGTGWYGNSGSGHGGHCFVGCIAHNNSDGFYNSTAENVFVNCIADSNATIGTQTAMDYSYVLMSRITNQAGAGDIGLDAGDELVFIGYNVFDTNTSDIANTALRNLIPMDANTDTNEYDPDADDGYNNLGNDDFNLKASRTYNGDGNDVIGLGIGS